MVTNRLRNLIAMDRGSERDLSACPRFSRPAPFVPRAAEFHSHSPQDPISVLLLTLVCNPLSSLTPTSTPLIYLSSSPLLHFPPTMSEEFFQQFHSDISKHSHLDSFHTYGDIFAPGIDQFESELDSDPSVAAFEIPQAFAADPTPAFTVLRSETFLCGPPSAFTADSDSAYNDSFSNHSSSIYSPGPAFGSTPSSNLPFDFDLDFSKINMENLSEYSAHDISEFSAAFGFDSYSSSPDNSPSMPAYTSRDTRSDYEPPLSVVGPMLTSMSEYTPSSGVKLERPIVRRQATLTPSSTVSPPATSPEPYVSSVHNEEIKLVSDDPKKKYQCPNCPRG